MRILKLEAVTEKVALKKSSVYGLMARGLFPKPVDIGVRATVWLESDVDKWIEAHVEKSRAAVAS